MGKDKSITIRLDEKTHEELESYASEFTVSRGWVVRKALVNFFKKIEGARK